MVISTAIWIVSILILWPLTSISWIKRHSKALVSAAILLHTAVLMYALFSERSSYWAFFITLGNTERLSLTYFSFFSIAACAIYLTGLTESNDPETNDELPFSFVMSNRIYIAFLCLLGLISLIDLYFIIITIFSFGSAIILICNLYAQERKKTWLPLVILAGFICFITSSFMLPLFMTPSFLRSAIRSFVIFTLLLCAIRCVKFFRFAWTASTVWLISLAIFMLINSTAPPALITDQMRLSNDNRFSYRIEIVDRGRNSEHVRLFTHEVETGEESTIILPELSGSLVIEDGEIFGDFVLWEDDRYVLFLDRRMWIGDTNWLAINEIDMSTESAVPISQFDREELFLFARNLWYDVRHYHPYIYFPSFAEVIQITEMLEQSLVSTHRWTFINLLDGYYFTDDSGKSFVEFVESQLAEPRENWWW